MFISSINHLSLLWWRIHHYYYCNHFRTTLLLHGNFQQSFCIFSLHFFVLYVMHVCTYMVHICCMNNIIVEFCLTKVEPLIKGLTLWASVLTT